MRYPTMSRSGKTQVNIPSFSGGVNLRDTKSGILDNQLSDAYNMWFKNGALRRRPNFETNLDLITEETFLSGGIPKATLNMHKDIRYKDGILCSAMYRQTGASTLTFFWQDKTEMHYFGSIQIYLGYEDEYITYFVAPYDDSVYVYLSNGDIYKAEFGYIKAFIQITDDDMIESAPVVITNALRTGIAQGDHFPEFSGVLINGFNLIGKYAKIIFSTVNPEYSHSDKNNMAMIYYFRNKSDIDEDDNKYDGYKVVVKHTTENGVFTHTVVIDGHSGDEEEIQGDGYKIRASSDAVIFYNVDGDIAEIDNSGPQIINNLEITFPHLTSNRDKISGCSFSEWYGGVSEGINGGTRLFISGNSKYPNSVFWSDLNNPLYFPENNWFKVGTDNSNVTAFGKQNEKLVIFKERETWYTEYTQTTAPTAEQVVNQSFIDLTTAKAMFPLVLINDQIGCDCPNTVQLCRNRLTFTNKSGKVYVIVTMNQYSENNIYEIGGMIEDKLRTETELEKATSADFEGYYCIMINDNMYLCDYNSDGFQYPYSFKNKEDSQLKVPWYIWKLPFDPLSTFYFGCDDFILAYSMWFYHDSAFGPWKGKYHVSLLTADNEGLSDKQLHFELSDMLEVITKIIRKEFESGFTTKFFTFGSADKRKNVERVSIVTDDNEGQTITVLFVTESGNETETYNTNTTDFSEVKTILPTTKSVNKFGISMSSFGKLSVEEITIIFRMLGVIR